MRITHHARKSASIAAVALILATAVPIPAYAKQDPGTTEGTTLVVTNQFCKHTRIGHQFVRCDNLSGAGVAAPSWILED